jgi:hypothetical protein
MTSHSAERVRRDGRSGETGETRFKRGSRNAERGILFCADGLRTKPAKLAKPAKQSER